MIPILPALVLLVLPANVPVDPDGPEARRWLLEELSKPAYQSAHPTPFDQLVRAITDWINSLINGLGSVQVPGIGNLLGLVAVVIVVVLLVVAFLVFGLPRISRRSSAGGALFAEHDTRDAAAMRRDAERAAAAGDYAVAITELFRALARGLDERTLVSTFPGTTASELATRAAEVFPDAASHLSLAAASFNGVRYLGAPGTAAEWEQLVALEREVRTAKPAQHVLDEQLIEAGQ
ncbi:MAG TPA: DUF4129 domain-containing protein [Pseudolysinimonas sp.]|nr:DUF4129 domain-containing protein [Pseudolysinimonas sp.]